MLRRSLLSLLVSFAVLSCSDSTAPEDKMLGTWRLETVSGHALPFILEQDETRTVYLTGETITLLESGSMTMVTSFRVTDGGTVFTESIPGPGNYSVNGSIVSMTFVEDGSTLTATVNGDLMTLDDIGLTFVYRRD